MIDFAAAREAMVDRQVRTADVTRYPIIAAMLAVPRELFVPAELRPVAVQRTAEHVDIEGDHLRLVADTQDDVVEALERDGVGHS